MLYEDVPPPGQFSGSIISRGSGRVRALSVGNPGTTHALSSIGGLLLGWCIRENTGTAAASFNLYNGGDSSGEIIAAVALLTGTTSMVWCGPDGIDVPSGLFFSTVTGQVRGVVYVRMDTGSGS